MSLGCVWVRALNCVIPEPCMEQRPSATITPAGDSAPTSPSWSRLMPPSCHLLLGRPFSYTTSHSEPQECTEKALGVLADSS